MKHLLNDIPEWERNSIREQHKGGITIDTSRFKKLMESKLGNVKPLIDVSDDKKLNTEGVVDTPSQNLSDIFIDGKINPKVKKIILDGILEIELQFPELIIKDYFLVGAAVTYQYTQTSDIDTTLVLDYNTDKDLMKKADKWIENNLDGKTLWLNKRPFQWKLTYEQTRDNLDSVDSAYDIENDSWIKEPPSFEDVSKMINTKIENKFSKENILYGQMEKTIQPILQTIYHELEKNYNQKDMSDLINRGYHRYEKGIKSIRKKSYGNEIELGYPSKNWGKGNFIYKMFDREDYNKVFSILKHIVKNNLYNDENELKKLKQSLKNVINDEIGYKI